MDNNDLLRRLRYALQLDDTEAARLATLGGVQVGADDMAAFRARDDDAEVRPCPDAVATALLNGLVTDRRGPSPDAARAVETLDNNTVLKRLKTALSMQTAEVYRCIELGGGTVSQSAVGAFLRRPGTRNFRGLGDQMLRRFLTGLALSRRDDRSASDE